MTTHGTLTGYNIHGCRCDECTAAQSRYNGRRRLLIASGRWQHRAETQPVRDHINQLRQAGLGWRRIARLADVSDGIVSRILYGTPTRGWGPSKHINPASAAALLAVHADIDTLADGARIDATGTKRRIQALVAIGWSNAEQARRLGVTRQSHSRIHGMTHVTAGLARTIRRLYDELSMTPAPDGYSAVMARREAARRGWVSPLAWDDATIDDPNATPDLGQPVLRKVALLEDVHELFDQHHTIDQAAERLGIGRSYIEKLLRTEVAA